MKWIAVDRHFELTDESGAVYALIGRRSSNSAGVQYAWSGSYFYRIIGQRQVSNSPYRRDLVKLAAYVKKVVEG